MCFNKKTLNKLQGISEKRVPVQTGAKGKQNAPGRLVEQLHSVEAGVTLPGCGWRGRMPHPRVWLLCSCRI